VSFPKKGRKLRRSDILPIPVRRTDSISLLRSYAHFYRRAAIKIALLRSSILSVAFPHLILAPLPTNLETRIRSWETTKLTKMRKPSPISVRFGKSEFLKINADRFDWRDTYHWVLSLSWSQFAGLVFGTYMIVNVIFAVLYVLGGKGIAEMHPGSFLDAFF